ncbi:MAG: MBL fold metallo-hydrolase [Promethearchaeota archaeon]|nr:MAG: MBL fold metallo-hydrolase [Candidatus Lokiarchaeota archaeon]
MGQINDEGKFNENTYLIDGMLFRLSGTIAIYVIENGGERMMFDTSEPLSARKIIKKLKEYDLFPIQKLLLTHSHWDHVQGWEKMKKLNGDFEILASENAIKHLRDPGIMNDTFGYKIPPIEGDITPLKDGDIIDLNGLELKVLNFFGHTQDSIAVLDEKNRNLFTGDSIMYKWDLNTMAPVIMPPEFNESDLVKTFEKLRNMRGDIDSVSMAHFGVWSGEDLDKLLDEQQDFYFKVKNSLIQWYSENPSIEYLASKYLETYIPNSTIHTKENIIGLHLLMSWMEGGLKTSGFI